MLPAECHKGDSTYPRSEKPILFPSVWTRYLGDTPPPWDVPLGPSTTANKPITNSSERALRSSNLSQQGSSSWKFSHPPPPGSLVLGLGTSLLFNPSTDFQK